MPPTPIITETPSHHLHIRPLYIALVTPFIIAGLAYAFIPSLRDGLGMLIHPVDEPTLTEMPMEEKPEVLGGSISLTLAEPGKAMGIYSYDIELGELIPNISTDSLDYFSQMRSPDGAKIAISTAPRTTDHAVTLWVGDSALDELSEITTGDALAILEATSWSPDGTKIALVGRSESDSEIGVSGNSVYVHDIVSGETTFVTNGIEALFTPAGTLLVLENDGLHHLDLASGENTLVVSPNDGAVSESMTLAISQDGSRIAWSDPLEVKVSVLNITSLTPFEYTVETTYDIDAEDIALSPRGEYLAVIEYSLDTNDEGTTTTNASLAAYTIVGDHKSGQLDITPYLGGFSGINYWR